MWVKFTVNIIGEILWKLWKKLLERMTKGETIVGTIERDHEKYNGKDYTSDYKIGYERDHGVNGGLIEHHTMRL